MRRANWTCTVATTSPSPTSAFFFLCPTFTTAGPVDQHLFMLPFGDAQVDPAGMVSLFAVPSGPTTVSLPLNFGAFNFAFVESDIYVQAAVFDAAGTTFTNRIRLELDL
jgi:hypothetical protein